MHIWNLLENSPAVYPPPEAYDSMSVSAGKPGKVLEFICSYFDIGVEDHNLCLHPWYQHVFHL